MDLLSIDSFTGQVTAAGMDLFFDVFSSDGFDLVLEEKNWLECLQGVAQRLRRLIDQEDLDEAREKIAGAIENTEAFIRYKRRN